MRREPKESKHVFYLHGIKVCSNLPIFLQECLVIFAANFTCWATHWLANQADPSANNLDLSRIRVKRQIKVGVHVSAQLIQDSQSKL